MKEEALKLADELDGLSSCEPVVIKACEDMIRKLVEELDKQDKELVRLAMVIGSMTKEISDKQTKPLSDEKIWDMFQQTQHNALDFARAIEAKVRGEE